jgi:hypothetical protein
MHTTFVEQSHPEMPRPMRKEAPLYRRGPMTLTPELAEHFREECLYPRQRNLSVANIARLAYILRKGQWLPFSPITIVSLPDGREWLINGNHTCEAVMRTGIPASVTLIIIDCASEDLAHGYYAAYDRQKPRTVADHRRAVGDDDLPLARYLFQAAGFILGGFEARQSPEVQSLLARSTLANDYAKEAEALAEALSRGVSENTRIIKRVPVLAMALSTIRYQREAGKKFWSDVAHDRGDVDTPSRAMIRQLRGFQKVTSRTWREQAKVVLLYWNAHMAGETRMHVQPAKAKTFKLAGTPIDLNTPPKDMVVGMRAGSDGLMKTSAIIPEEMM